MNINKRTTVFFLGLGLGLIGCGSGEAPSNTALGACQEAMKLNAAQLRSDAEGTQRLIEGCEQAMFEHGAEDWKCVVAAMKSGKKYLPATEECFKK